MMPVLDQGKTAGAVVLASGGLDSTVLLCWAKQEYASVEALSIGYHSLHGHAEMVACERICRELGVARIRIDLPRVFGPSALTGDSSKSNVVPARNVVLVAHGIARAAAIGAQLVLFGATQEDHADFADCRPPFFTWAARMAEIGTNNAVTVRAPFCTIPKVEVIQMGLAMGAPLHLTHTCYRGVRPGCGECQACKVRAAAFAAAEVADPIFAPVPA